MPDPLKLPVRLWVEVRRGLGSLDAIKEGSDIIALDYDVQTRGILMRNAELVERELVSFDKLDRHIAATHGVVQGMELTGETAPRIAHYMKDLGDAKDAELEIGVTKIKLEKLLKRPDGKSNKVPQSVLARLAPILED